jgi:muramoyltetrapeptide carboxypeptidase LdcA involved in peptidoglycan recycling
MVLSDLIVPHGLRAGDKVATVSLSWGGAGEARLRARYEAGKKQLQDAFGVQVIEMPNTLKGADYLYRNPQARVDDLHQAFEDGEIKAVISCIGGDDSVRLIDRIDSSVLRANPKVFMGYSDTTVAHFVCLRAGLRSYYGPALLSGFAENGGMHDYLIQSVRRSVFSSHAIGTIESSKEGWTSERLEWDVPENQHIKRKMQPPMDWRFLQGQAVITARLLRACAEYGRQDLPIVTRMDFGHTDPMFVIPIGARATIDPVAKRFSVDEPGCR